MPIETVQANPKDSFSCLALVKRGSLIATEWKLEKLTYCIYEYELAFDTHEIRWGDGSWQNLDEEDYLDIVLLREFDESTWGEIIGD